MTPQTQPAAPAFQPAKTQPPAASVASQPSPFFTEPEPAAQADEDLQSEPPVVVSAPSTPAAPAQADIATLLEAPVATSSAATGAPGTIAPETGEELAATPTEFPEPFPEMSEGEADDLNEEEFESPFVGLKLDEEPFPAAEVAAQPAPTPTAEEVDPLAAPSPAPAPSAAPALVVDVPSPAATSPAGPQLNIPNAAPALTLPGTEAATPKAEIISTDAPPAPAAQIVDTSSADQNAERMKQIRERGGMKGLKGFCPVSLRDQRELKDSLPEFAATYRGQKFHFANAEAKAKFEQNPAHYAPAAYGADVVVLIRDKDVAEGSLDFAAWYKGNLYLFGTEETYTAFLADPVKYSAPAGLE
jgi:YHS domain-containing protein